MYGLFPVIVSIVVACVVTLVTYKILVELTKHRMAIIRLNKEILSINNIIQLQLSHSKDEEESELDEESDESDNEENEENEETKKEPKELKEEVATESDSEKEN